MPCTKVYYVFTSPIQKLNNFLNYFAIQFQITVSIQFQGFPCPFGRPSLDFLARMVKCIAQVHILYLCHLTRCQVNKLEVMKAHAGLLSYCAELNLILPFHVNRQDYVKATHSVQKISFFIGAGMQLTSKSIHYLKSHQAL